MGGQITAVLDSVYIYMIDGGSANSAVTLVLQLGAVRMVHLTRKHIKEKSLELLCTLPES